MLAGLPYGAVGQDTAEYMLGSVVATVVFFESNGSIDPNLENWTPQHIEETKGRITEGMQWWEDTLVNFYEVNYDDVEPIHSLNFILDFAYADNPVPTGYEPIARVSQDYPKWVGDFLRHTGYLATGSIDTDIRTFNNGQRLKHNADWAFTIFVANDYNDADGLFAPGSQFSQAFAFAGGRFIVAPSRRPASTFAHETGHIFYARDEYQGSGASYIDRRGYYNSQNWNAWDNPTPGFVQQTSLMSSGLSLQTAYANHISSESSLAMIGWRDADGDGVFDVLDVPLSLRGSGYYDPVRHVYRFVGSSSVGTLPNINSSGRRNDITINQVSQLAYSLNGGGTWTVFRNYNAPEVAIDVSIPVQAGDEILIRTQAVDPRTQRIVTTSDKVFSGSTSLPTTVMGPGIQGFVWYDKNLNGQWDLYERGVPGWTMQLVDASGVALPTEQYLEPDSYQNQELLNSVLEGVTLTAVGYDVKDGRVGALNSASASAEKVFGLVRFGAADSWVTQWTSDSRNLRIDFDTPTTYVSIEALSAGSDAYGRLEVYDSLGNLIDRYSTHLLRDGAAETMWLGTATPRIAYALVRATNDTSILLDNLQVGPSSSVVTDSLGAYAFSYLPSGQYHVRGVPTSEWTFAAPLSGIVDVTVAASGDMQWLAGTDRPSDFAARPAANASPWKNLILPLDVNDDWFISPIDALLVINDLNLNGSRVLPPPSDGQSPPPYLDVTGDGNVSPIDVLWIINHLNGASGSSTLGGSGSGGGSGESGDGEGEALVWAEEAASSRSSGGGLSGADFATPRAVEQVPLPGDFLSPPAMARQLSAAGMRLRPLASWGGASVEGMGALGLSELLSELLTGGVTWLGSSAPGILPRVGGDAGTSRRLDSAPSGLLRREAATLAESRSQDDLTGGQSRPDTPQIDAGTEDLLTLIATENWRRRLRDEDRSIARGLDGGVEPVDPEGV